MSKEAPETIPWEGRILVVTNLSYDVRPTALKDFLTQKGKVYRVDIERTKKGGSNGLAFVEFATSTDAQAAVTLHGTQFEGRTMKCQVSTNPPPELVRFYIRPPENRPVSKHTRRRIIEEAMRPAEEPNAKRRLSCDSYSDFSDSE